MTKEGYERLKAQLEHMENVEWVEVTKRIAAARDMGDLSENAEYHAAREAASLLQGRINDLKDRLGRAEIIDPSTLPKDTIVFGARVKLKDLDLEEEEEVELVGPGQEDYEKNRILTSSPRGQALLGKKIGDLVEINVPRGVLRYEVLGISFPYLEDKGR
jgi:transcription elongation factor GreA